MAPFVLLITLASILALVTAQSGTGTGTGTGLYFPSVTLAARAPYPFPNATFPIGPTATSPSSVGFLVPRAVVPTAPYPIPGSTGLPGTGTGYGTGTGTGTGFALPTGYPKRMEMRGLKRVRGEKKRAARWW